MQVEDRMIAIYSFIDSQFSDSLIGNSTDYNLYDKLQFFLRTWIFKSCLKGI